jgi:hypothetical protein
VSYLHSSVNLYDDIFTVLKLLRLNAPKRSSPLAAQLNDLMAAASVV